jgi:hypothetical protein
VSQSECKEDVYPLEMTMTKEIRQAFVYRCCFSYKPVYRFCWKYADERMTVYSEPLFATEALAQENLNLFIQSLDIYKFVSTETINLRGVFK